MVYIEKWVGKHLQRVPLYPSLPLTLTSECNNAMKTRHQRAAQKIFSDGVKRLIYFLSDRFVEIRLIIVLSIQKLFGN